MSDQKYPKLQLYGRSSCGYCRRVERVIQQLGIEQHIERCDASYSSNWRQDLLQRTGRTQVPCLFVDDVPMFESLDIIAWLRRQFSNL